jgi:hypothetical protein
MSLPINGNQYFTKVDNIAAQPQRVAADSLKCTFFGTTLTTAPTGATGPFNTTPYAGQVVLASTGPVGTGLAGGAGIYVYTGSKWVRAALTD